MVARRIARPSDWVQRAALVLVSAAVAVLGGRALGSAEDELAAAERLRLRGKYAEAEEVFARHVPDEPDAVLGMARTLTATGRDEAAMKLLARAARQEPRLHAELARIAFARGQYGVADAHTEIALALDQNNLLARWMRAELLRVTGRLAEADDACRWLVRHYNSRSLDDPQSLCWIGLAAARYARWHRLSDQFSLLVNELYPRALQRDPGYWPAAYQAGLLFLEKYNRADAVRHFQQALQVNANAAEVHAAMARLALQEHDFLQARRSAERALEINPRLLDAWLVQADLAWANFDPAGAMRLLRQHALPLNPRSEQTLGRLAACLLLERQQEDEQTDRFAELVEQATAANPACGDFFFTLASWLQERHQMAAAERFFRESIARMPQKVGPHAALGLLYMHAGREEEARRQLEEAFRVDPFNVRVYNMLEVLDLLAEMKTIDTGNCILRFDGHEDEILGTYAAQQADRCFRQLCEQFGFRPPEKPLVEIFRQAKGTSGHQWFSTRMTGLPYLGTVAASTGKVVALVSPNDPQLARPFNWARVLRHELVHVITLQQTGFNCPHWFTEGLAVWSEDCPTPPQWLVLLAQRAASNDLFDLKTINFGFTRPHSSDDCHLAYCQAEQYVQFIIDRYGWEAIQRLLKAYAEKLPTGAAIKQALGIPPEEFELRYRQYVDRLIADVHGPGPHMDFGELLQAHRDEPDNADVAARLAAEYLRRGATDEAEQVAEQVSAREPGHQLAAYVLARLALRAGRTAEAIQRLDQSLDPGNPQPETLNLLATLRFRNKEYAEAARLYQLGAEHYPHDSRWLDALARVHLAAGHRKALADVLAQLANHDVDDLVVRRKLAQMAIQRGDHAAATRWATEAIQIDVLDAAAHHILAQALAAQGQGEEAVAEFEVAIQLDPGNTEAHLGLADALTQLGQTAEARQVLEQLLQQASDSTAARHRLQQLDKAADRR
ncbi:MAG TPA: tetratricopeptide repeat protein [Planctomycetaceae bacterium]|nr:tetratricopeptide repeat protein [Planctomycetaceae bacterium]